MNQAQTPAFPTAADSQPNQRLLAQLGELTRQLIGSAVFLMRPSVEPIRVPSADRPTALRWGSLNRVLLTADFPVHLPRIEPRFVGVPLEFIFLGTGSNVAEVTPTGVGSDRRSRPLINGATSLNVNTVGLYVLKTDGQNWFGGRLT